MGCELCGEVKTLPLKKDYELRILKVITAHDIQVIYNLNVSMLRNLDQLCYDFQIFCRIPWFQYPIIYDIRAKPRKISSLTGSKGNKHGGLSHSLSVTHSLSRFFICNSDLARA